MTTTLAAKLVRLESQVIWWRDQGQQIERDRANLRFMPPIGLVLGMLGVWFKPLIGGALLALSLVIWGMGMYMTMVRRSEFREHLREAQAELDEVEQAIQAQHPNRAAQPTTDGDGER